MASWKLANKNSLWSGLTAIIKEHDGAVVPILKAEIERASDGILHPVVVHCLAQLSPDAARVEFCRPTIASNAHHCKRKLSWRTGGVMAGSRSCTAGSRSAVRAAVASGPIHYACSSPRRPTCRGTSSGCAPRMASMRFDHCALRP